MATKAEALGEFERIARFFAPLAAPGGLGLLDDAALVDCRAGRRLVITADAMVAGIHFRPEDPAEFVARKLLRVNLSDLAAMGARPLYYLLTTALPAALGAQWVEDFARGLGQDQQLYQVAMLGSGSVCCAATIPGLRASTTPHSFGGSSFPNRGSRSARRCLGSPTR